MATTPLPSRTDDGSRTRTSLPVLGSQPTFADALPTPAEFASHAPLPGGVRTLIDDFLAVQGTTTAVERFAANDPRDGGAPAQARWYRDLLPATPPAPGQQYAFRVDLDACSGCKACVTACHSLNGLDDGQAWRDVGLLVGTGQNALVQPVTTGCHHCADPGCLTGCPVDAYVKLDSGVVKHLDDQCIGCQYCTLTCPYEVPQYDAGRGVVRKCDLCHDRLADGEAPACVQACPTSAIEIAVVDLDTVGDEAWPFEAPGRAQTRPSTSYTTQRDLHTDVASAGGQTVATRHAHPPLVAMLVLTQLAVGAFAALEVTRLVGGLDGTRSDIAATVTLGVALLGLLASLAHLGRPHLAWRAVIGLRHSWLSREIVAFGMFAPLAGFHAAILGGVAGLDPNAAVVTGPLAVAAGLAAVGTSVMVYVATGREGWGPLRTTLRFGLTTLSLGGATATLLVTALGADARGPLVVAGVTTAVAMLVDVLPLVEGRQRAGRTHVTTPMRTARLLRGPVAGLLRLRVGAGLVALLATVVTAALASGGDGPTLVFAALALLAAGIGEAAARWWFFTAEGSPRMPTALR